MTKNFLLLPDKLTDKEKECLESIINNRKWDGEYYRIGDYAYNFSSTSETDKLGNDISYTKVSIREKYNTKIICTIIFDSAFFYNEILKYLRDYARSNSLHHMYEHFMLNIKTILSNIDNTADVRTVKNNIITLFNNYRLNEVFQLVIIDGDPLAYILIPLNNEAAKISENYYQDVKNNKEDK